MQYGFFDNAHREYVITRPDTPLPWINYLGCEAYFGLISNTAGGYSFYRDARLRRLTRYRYNNAPLDTGGRYIYLRDDAADAADRRFLVAVVAAGPPRAGGLHLPARDGLHDHRLDLPRHRSQHPLLRPARRESGGLAADRDQPPRRAGAALGLLRHRVLPVGRAGRCDQLPAQLQHRPGRGGRGRGRDLPQDRVPGAPRSLRLLRLLRAAGRLRHAARRVPGAVPRLGRSRGRGTRRVVRLHRARLAADRLAPCQADAPARREPADHLPAGVPRKPGGRQVRPARLADDQQADRPSRSSPNTWTRRPRTRRSPTCARTGSGRSASSRWPRPTSTPTGWSTSGTRTSA